MDHLNKIFRYKMSTICFIIGIIVSYLAIYFGVANQREIEYAIKETKKYEYEYSCDYSAIFKDKLYIPNYGQGNCTIKSFPVSVDERGTDVLCNIIVYANEELLLPFLGNVSVSEYVSVQEPIAIIGENYKDYTDTKDGKDYIYINGERYRVAAYLSGEISKEFDGYVILFYDNVGENVRSQLFDSNGSSQIFISLESNLHDINAYSKTLINDVSPYGLLYREAKDEDYYGMVSVIKTRSYFWVFTYCLLIDVIVSCYWVYERRRELSIRRAFGYSKKDVVKLMLSDFFGQLLPALLCAAVIAGIIQKFLLVGVISVSSTLVDNVTALAFSMLIPMVSMCVPLYAICYKVPIIEIEKRE